MYWKVKIRLLEVIDRKYSEWTMVNSEWWMVDGEMRNANGECWIVKVDWRMMKIFMLRRSNLFTTPSNSPNWINLNVTIAMGYPAGVIFNPIDSTSRLHRWCKVERRSEMWMVNVGNLHAPEEQPICSEQNKDCPSGATYLQHHRIRRIESIWMLQ